MILHNLPSNYSNIFTGWQEINVVRFQNLHFWNRPHTIFYLVIEKNITPGIGQAGQESGLKCLRYIMSEAKPSSVTITMSGDFRYN